MSDQQHALTADQLAQRYGVSIETIRRLVKRGLPHYRLGGRLFRFNPDETDVWMHSHHRAPSTSDSGDDYRAYVRQMVAAAPELSAEQAERIRAILADG